MTIKVAHMSDLHYCDKHLEEVDKCFGFAVDNAEADVAVISGDLFDASLPVHSPAVAALMYRIHRLANKMPVLILQGTRSHDAPGALDIFRTIGGLRPVYVADAICQVALCESRENGVFWEDSGNESGFWGGPPDFTVCLFSCLPSVNKAAVAANTGTDNVGVEVGDAVHHLLTGWSEPNMGVRSIGIPTVVVAHGTVSGSVTEHGVPMAGLDHEFTTGTLFASEAAAVMLGHIHQYQSWGREDGCAVAYAGSIGRLHYGELQDKGFLMWTVSAESATHEFVVTPAKRLLQLEFSGPPDMEELAKLAEHAEGAHVRIRYTVDEEHRHAVDREAIAGVFSDAAECQIEGSINPVTRVRAEGISRQHALADQLRTWATTTDTDVEPLIPRMELLQHKDPEQIVRDVLEPADDLQEAAP